MHGLSVWTDGHLENTGRLVEPEARETDSDRKRRRRGITPCRRPEPPSGRHGSRACPLRTTALFPGSMRATESADARVGRSPVLGSLPRCVVERPEPRAMAFRMMLCLNSPGTHVEEPGGILWKVLTCGQHG